MNTKFKATPSSRTGPATMATHAVHTEATPPGENPAGNHRFPQDRVGESAVRATDSPAIQHCDANDISESDDVDRSLDALRIGRQSVPEWDPRTHVREAASMMNPELADLLVRLSAEHDRVSRLRAKQDYIIGRVRHDLRDREVHVRRSAPSSPTTRLDDIVWLDPVCRALRDALLLQERVLEELKADILALDRHHTAVSRLIEIRRQEQQRDLIDINVPNRRAYPRWGKPR